MIDEYQDSNKVQEEIMRAISMEPEGGHNLFMVEMSSRASIGSGLHAPNFYG